MSDNPFIQRMQEADRQSSEKKIRKLQRRLAEVENLSVGPLDSAEAEALKSAGGEAGKRLVQAPWWMSVGLALQSVVEALTVWIISFRIS
jgi:hypothetical protein